MEETRTYRASFDYSAVAGGTKMVALNPRCLDEVNIETLTLTQHDGKSL